MDIYQRLTQDHHTHRELACKITETEGDSEERRSLWTQFKSDVEAHAAAEEQAFYGVMIQKPEGQDKARHSISEHEEISELIEELSKLEMSSSGWLQKFNKLNDRLEHHMDEEENEIFKRAENLIKDDKAIELADAFDQKKKQELSN
jgi:hemerythrin-like domain-containing protein